MRQEVKVLIKLAGCQAITLPQGIIYLGSSNRRRSAGFLKLNPGQGLTKHNRPVDEKLKQISGSSVIGLYEEERLIKEISLRKGDELIIPAKQYHAHKNPSKQNSLVYWQFDGDIAEIIENIKKTPARKKNVL